MSTVTGPRRPQELDVAPNARRRLRPPTLGFATGCALAVLGLCLGLVPLSDNSFLTHLATGRLILERGGVPHVDPYSFTAVGQPFVVQSWLASLLYAVVERLAGGVGLVLLMGVTTAAVSTLVWRLTAGADDLLARLVPAVLATAVGAMVWSGRPLLFGLVFLALVLLAADDRLDPRWLLAVGWLWANTHGSFPFGVGVLVLMIVGRRLDGLPARVERRALTWLGPGLLAGVVGPLGTGIVTTPLAALQKRSSFLLIREWQAPTYQSWWELLFLMSLVVAAAAVVRRPSWRAALPVLVFAVLACTAVRNIAVFGVVAAAPTATGLAGLGGVLHTARRRAARVVVVAAAAMACTAVVAAVGRDGVDLRGYPLEAVAFLEQRGTLDDPGQRLASPVLVGNLLTYERGAQARVFMDDRVDTFPASLVADYGKLHRPGADWQGVLDRYGITTVLWQEDSGLGALLSASPAWTVTYRDDGWLVAERH